MFYLYCVTTNEFVMVDTDERYTFVSGQEAKNYGDCLAENTGYKYQPRPVTAGDINWKEREAARFESGEYKRVELLENAGYVLPDHFVHYSNKTCSDLAYTKSEEKGRLDLQTKISLSGYLEIYFSKVVSAKEISRLSEENELLFVNNEIKFATTADEIEYVYTHPSEDNSSGQGSCMRSPAKYYTDNTHPTRAYAAGDLAVAYLADKNNRVTDRALCWPAKKIYSRVYGKGDRLHAVLRKLGYQKSKYYDNQMDKTLSFIGAKLSAIPVKSQEYPDSFIVPYIDERDSFLVEKDGYLVIDDFDGDINAKVTSGRSTKVPFLICKFCGNLNRFDKTTNILLDFPRRSYDHDDVFTKCCEECAKTNGFKCEGYNQYVSSAKFGESIQLEIYDYNLPENDNYKDFSHTVCMEWLVKQSKYEICAFDSKFAYNGKGTNVIVDELGTVQVWGPHSVKYFSVLRDGKRYAKTITPPEMVKVVTDHKKRMIYSSWTVTKAKKDATLIKLYGRKPIYVSNSLLKLKKSFFDIRMKKPMTIIEQMREAA